ncbi:MAG: hypothetical protein H6733_12130 [Alphaproteobacteria bacterium]|nr:hypothetical protein [Alphaproteobacteria bacterium]
MAIKGIEGMTQAQLDEEIDKGARFILFEYTISILIMTFKRPSSIYFVRAGESRHKHGVKYGLITLFFGWWGIPWGPIYSIGSLLNVANGGKDVTNEVLNSAG